VIELRRGTDQWRFLGGGARDSLNNAIVLAAARNVAVFGLRA